VQS
jgi:hypothetical protein